MALGFYRGVGAGLVFGSLGAVMLAAAIGLPERLRPPLPLANPPVTETEEVTLPGEEAGVAAPAADTRVETAGPARLEPPAPAESQAPPRPGISAPRLAAPSAPDAMAEPALPGSGLASDPAVIETPDRGQAAGLGVPGASTATRAAPPNPEATPPLVGVTAPLPQSPDLPQVPEAPGGLDRGVSAPSLGAIGTPGEQDSGFGGAGLAPSTAPDVGLDSPALPQAPDAPLGPDASLKNNGQAPDNMTFSSAAIEAVSRAPEVFQGLLPAGVRPRLGVLTEMSNVLGGGQETQTPDIGALEPVRRASDPLPLPALQVD